MLATLPDRGYRWWREPGVSQPIRCHRPVFAWVRWRRQRHRSGTQPQSTKCSEQLPQTGVNHRNRRGWPSNLGGTVDSALQRNIDYLDHARKVDVRSISGPRRDPERLRQLMTSLARNTATEVKISAPLTRLARRR